VRRDIAPVRWASFAGHGRQIRLHARVRARFSTDRARSLLVLGVNLGVDRTLRLERLLPGYVQRPRSAVATAGGKAVNICRASRAHGVRPRLVANLPGRVGELVGDMLVAEGHDVRRVVTAGEARSQIIIVEDDARITVLNEPGPELSEPDLARLLGALIEELPGHGVVAASGSLPPGAPDDLYGRVVERARAAGAMTVVDAARAALRACLPFEPDVVTPNLAEASAALIGTTDEAVEAEGDDPRSAALEAARGLRAAGARAALVTAGRHGVAGADAGGCFWIAAPSVPGVNPVGAGDSFVAGLAVALERGATLRQATITAVATGSASVAHPLAGGVEPRLVAELEPALILEPA
jgi:1-phosphofructokinase family hexose kinase